jgi:superfamily II DNA or RNA helicase
VAGLNTIARLGCSALVIVPRKRIAQQWRKSAVDFLGLCPSRIGSIEEGKFSFKGKAITVAVIHNLVDRKMPEGFEDAFGTVIYDEAHNLGARTFSLSMSRVFAKYRIALSATPDRGDGCENLFFDYFGRPSVIYPGDTLPTVCRVFNFNWTFPPKVAKNGRPIRNDINRKPRAVLKKILISSKRRNSMMSDMIHKLYESGRNVLVMGDEILHLQVLMGMVTDAGVPADHCGLYTGSYVDAEGKRKGMNDEQLDWVKAHSRVIFATYAMAGEALDIPRMDAGIDVTPHSKGIQMIGRIQRPVAGKPTPLWLTIRDRGIRIFESACESRLRGFRENNVTVIEQNGQKTKIPNGNGSYHTKTKMA